MDGSRIDQLKKFLEHNPGDSFVRYALATEYISRGDDDTGLTYFKSILETDPDYTGVYYHLGKLYQRRKERALAEQTFREGLKRTMGKDLRAHAELQQALNDLLYEEDE
jgi:Flp pilus assembly protein TadD